MHYRVGATDGASIWIPAISSTINFSSTWTDSSSLDGYSISVKSEGWVEICPDAPQHIDWHLEQFATLNNMLSWLSGWTMSPDKITAVNDPQWPTSVLYKLRDRKYAEAHRQLDIFIPCSLLGSNFAQALVRWFEVYPTVKQSCRLAISITASEGLWNHVEFLSWMQALEGFHRSVLGGNYVEESDYEAVKKALVDAIPSECPTTITAVHRCQLREGV